MKKFFNLLKYIGLGFLLAYTVFAFVLICVAIFNLLMYLI